MMDEPCGPSQTRCAFQSFSNRVRAGISSYLQFSHCMVCESPVQHGHKCAFHQTAHLAGTERMNLAAASQVGRAMTFIKYLANGCFKISRFIFHLSGVTK